MKLLRGRTARIERRRWIIARLMAISHELVKLRDLGSSTNEDRYKLLDEHTNLCLELTEITAIDDRRIVTKK